jgi:hypothetical protein
MFDRVSLKVHQQPYINHILTNQLGYNHMFTNDVQSPMIFNGFDHLSRPHPHREFRARHLDLKVATLGPGRIIWCHLVNTVAALLGKFHWLTSNIGDLMEFNSG